MTISDPSELRWKYMPIDGISPSSPLFYIECVVIPVAIPNEEIREKKYTQV